MIDWSSYRPEDFLLFSERSYWRLFARANLNLWPLQIPILLLGAATPVWLLRPRPWSDRTLCALVALLWIAVGMGFLGRLYAEINWVAAYVAPLFVVQGFLFAWFGLVRKPPRAPFGFRFPDLAGLGLFLYALALHPLLPLLAGRPLVTAEIVGIAPDPSAIATLGLLVVLPRGAASALMLAVPLLWCLASAATLMTMGAPEGWIPLTAAVLALAARVWPRRN